MGSATGTQSVGWKGLHSSAADYASSRLSFSGARSQAPPNPCTSHRILRTSFRILPTVPPQKPSSQKGRPQTSRAELLQDPATLPREVEPLAPRSAREQAEDELARFFAQSLDLLCIAGLDGFFKSLNPAWTTCLGWTLEELMDKPFVDLVHPEDRVATLAEVAKLAEGVETILFDNRYRHKDGSYRWLQWNARTVPGGQSIYATARDVTRLEREVLEIVDREKERLGHELHDGLCQSLAGIAALSATLSRTLSASSEPAASEAAAQITELLNETIGQARDMARGLVPVGLNEVGLEGALETLAHNVQQLFRVPCILECDRPFPRLRREVEAHVFRIAQQAVHNAVDHARADRIELRLSWKDGEGLLSVGDDGAGLPEEASNSDGIGLHTMAYRARLIGGSLEVGQCTPRGTELTCTFPLPETPDAHEDPNDDGNDT